MNDRAGGLMSTFDSAYGQRVRNARVAAELTQTQLGELLSLGRSSIANIEAGRQSMSAEQAVRTAAVLKVPAHWLLTGEESFAPPTQVITRRWVLALADNLRDVVTEIDTTLKAT